MKLNLYVAFDKVAKKTLFTFNSASDSLAVRENAPNLSRLLPVGDVELRKVGILDDETCKIQVLENYESVSWDCYEFPESPIVKQEVTK